MVNRGEREKMKIEKVVAAPGLTGFYFDDQLAIKKGAVTDGAAYRGRPLTKGFRQVRQKGEALSIIFLLSGGEVVTGDCVAVQYSGADGRDPLFLAKDFLPLAEGYLAARLTGLEINSFRQMAAAFDACPGPEGRRLHTALRYGVSQALLAAVAAKEQRLMWEVLAEEYQLPLILEPVPIFAQSGDDRYTNADKALIKGADVLPHGLINQIPGKLGLKGVELHKYVVWLRRRVEELGGKDYRPVLHLDVYGTLGLAFNHDLEQICDYLCRLEEAAKPLFLRLEGPVDMGSKEKQIAALARLKAMLERKGSIVEIVADEWCNTFEDVKDFVDAGAGHMIQVKTPDLGSLHNTIEAILYARKHGAGAYLGGSCNETDRAAQVCVHVALATRPDQMLAKPGMGVDEGMMIVHNEMQRALRLLRLKTKGV